MDLNYFVFDFTILIITNDYGNVGVDLDEWNTDFSGWLCEEKIANMWLLSCQHTWNGGDFRIKLVLFGTSKIHDFWCEDTSMRYLSIGFGITQFRVVWQSYDQFTQDYAEYIETGNWTGTATLRKSWYWLGHWKIVIFGF